MSSLSLSKTEWPGSPPKVFQILTSSVSSNIYPTIQSYLPAHLQLDPISFVSARVVSSQSSATENQAVRNSVLVEYHHPKRSFSFMITVQSFSISILPPGPSLTKDSQNNLLLRFMTTGKELYSIQIAYSLLENGSILHMNDILGLTSWYQMKSTGDLELVHFSSTENAVYVANVDGSIILVKESQLLEDSEEGFIEVPMTENSLFETAKMITQTPKKLLEVVADTPKKLLSAAFSGFLGSPAVQQQRKFGDRVLSITSTSPQDIRVMALCFGLHRNRTLRVYSGVSESCIKTVHLPASSKLHEIKGSDSELLPETCRPFIKVFDECVKIVQDQPVSFFKVCVFLAQSDDAAPFFCFYQGSSSMLGELNSFEFIKSLPFTESFFENQANASLYSFLIDFDIKPLSDNNWLLVSLWNRSKQSRLCLIKFRLEVESFHRRQSKLLDSVFAETSSGRWRTIVCNSEFFIRAPLLDESMDVSDGYIAQIFLPGIIQRKVCRQALIDYVLNLPSSATVSAQVHRLIDQLSSDNAFRLSHQQLAAYSKEIIGCAFPKGVEDSLQHRTLLQVEWDKFLNICNQLNKEANVPLSLHIDDVATGNILVYTRSGIMFARPQSQIEVYSTCLHQSICSGGPISLLADGTLSQNAVTEIVADFMNTVYSALGNNDWNCGPNAQENAENCMHSILGHLEPYLLNFDSTSTIEYTEQWAADRISELTMLFPQLADPGVWTCLKDTLNECDSTKICAEINKILKLFVQKNTKPSSFAGSVGLSSLMNGPYQSLFYSIFKDRLDALNLLLVHLIIFEIFSIFCKEYPERQKLVYHLELLIVSFKQAQMLKWLIAQESMQRQRKTTISALLEQMSVSNEAPVNILLLLELVNNHYFVESWNNTGSIPLTGYLTQASRTFVEQLGFLSFDSREWITLGFVTFCQKLATLKQWNLLRGLVDVAPKGSNCICFLQGLLLIQSKSQMDEGYKLLDRASNCFMKPISNQETQLMSILLSEQNLTHLGYYIYLTRFCQDLDLPQGTVYFGSRAKLLNPNPTELPQLVKSVFAAYIKQSKCDDAFMELLKMDINAQKSCLGAFITAVCEKTEWKKLVTGQYKFNFEVEEEMHEILLFKAKNSISYSFEDNYSMIIYLILIKQRQFKKASAVMFDLGKRIETKKQQYHHKYISSDSSQMVELHEMTSAQTKSYLLSLSALRQAYIQDQWIINERFMEDQLVISDYKKRLATSASNRLVTLNQLETEYLVSMAKLTLSTCNPELLSTSWNILPADLVSLFSKEKMYPEALNLASSLKIEKNGIFESMACTCLNLAKGLLKPTSSINLWLSGYSGSIGDKAFSALKHFLEIHDSRETNFELYLSVVDRILFEDKSYKLPVWLISFFMSTCPQDLMKLYIKYDRLSDATEFVFELINEFEHFVAAPKHMSRMLPLVQIEQILQIAPNEELRKSLDLYQKNCKMQSNTFIDR